MLLTPIQPKILTSKILHSVPHCANEYVKKEKEKNTTHFHSRVIFKATCYLIAGFRERSIRIVRLCK